MQSKEIRFKALFLSLLICGTLTGCKSKSTVDAGKIDLTEPGIKIAVEVNTPMETAIMEQYPNAERIYVNNMMDGLLNIKSGKTVAFCVDLTALSTSLENGTTGIEIFEQEENFNGEVAVAISPKAHIENADELINGFINQLKEDGTLDDIINRWTKEKNSTMPEIAEPSNPDKTIRVATTGLVQPYTFMQNGQVTGIDIELAKRFALYANAKLDIQMYDWTGLFTVISTDKVDYAFSNCFIREESTEIIKYSIPYNVVRPTVIIAASEERAVSLWNKIRNSFEKNFVRENRWKDIVSGIFITLEIFVLSVTFGSVLGFIVCLGKRSHLKMISSTLNGITLALKGVPVLILLMILYYVIFSGANNIFVAIIAFSISFATYISDVMKASIDGIEKGQWEAAATLGYTHNKTFVKIILPQALRTFLPAFIGSAVSILLLTSVVGYISIIDVTYAVQLIRSRTYEPFFPLILTAIVYVIITYLFSTLVRRLGNYFLYPKNCLRDINKGVTIKPYIKEHVAINKNEVVIKVSGLSKVYENAVPLKNLDCEIRYGEIISVIGSSGTGKSTLLRCINRLETPTEGEIRIFNYEVTGKKEKELTDIRRKMGMVFQNFNLFPHLSVIENIMLAPVEIKKVSRQEAYEKGMALLELVGLSDKALNYPEMLSGGQKQRVAIARTMAMDPAIILFDEPTSALDPKMVGEVLLVMSRLSKMGMTMLVVTHEMKFAREVSSRVFYMDQGIVFEQGSPEQIFENAKTEKCRAFIHNLKVLTSTIEKSCVDLPGEFTKILGFCNKYFLDEKQLLKYYQIIEELCVTLILSKLHDGEKVSYYAAYDSETKTSQMRIEFAGKQWNPMEDSENISIKLVKAKTKKVEYSFDNDVNTINIEF